jgi:hypothetical protein
MSTSTEEKRLPLAAKSADRWPDDYCVLDEGRLYVRKDYQPVLSDRGWDRCDGVMQSLDCTVVRRVEQRDNCLVELPNPRGGITRAYLKRHWTTQSGSAPSPGLEEAAAVGRCQGAGVKTMSIIAAGEQRNADGTVESFFMSEEIPGGLPADEFWRLRMGPPGESSLAPAEHRLQLLECLAATARQFHQANLFHRDFYWCHFFVTERAPCRFAAHLIDLQRVLQPRRFRWRWQLKDLAQFRFSVPVDQLSDEEIEFWFRCYFGGKRPAWPQRIGMRLISARAALYRRREGRRRGLGGTNRKAGRL